MENEEPIGLESKPKKLKLLPILLVILFASIIGAGSWFYVDAGRKEKQAEEDKAVQETTGSSQSTATDSGATSSATNSSTSVDETADWETYTNNTYNFSFKYPKGWVKSLDEISGTRKELIISSTSNSQQPAMNLLVDPNGRGPYFPDITYALTEKDNKVEVSKRTVEPVSENNTDKTTLIYSAPTKLKANEYWFMFSYKEGTENFETTYQKILSTFRFTVSTADWETYTNSTYGFSFKYPKGWTKQENPGEGLVQLYSNLSEGRSLDPDETKIVISALDDNTGANLDAHIKETYGANTAIKSIKVGNLTGKQIETVTSEMETKITVAYVLQNGIYLEIMCMVNSDLFSTILSTFNYTSLATADWKTYNNTTYGYSIKYPKDWVLDSTKLTEVTLNSPENIQVENDIKAGKYYGEGYMKDITVSYFENIAAADGNNPKKWNNLSDMVNDKIMFGGLKETTLAGVKAYEATEGGFSAYYVVLTEKDGHIYKILFGNKESASKLTNTDKAFLSSFQFTR